MKKSFLCVCGALIKDIFTCSGRAVIIAVHSESVYLRLDSGRVWLLCPYRYGRIPFGAALLDYSSFRQHREYRVGEYVDIDCGMLRFSDESSVQLTEKNILEACFKYKTLPSAGKLAFCSNYLREHGSARGIAPSSDAFLCFGTPDTQANIFALKAAAEADYIEQALVLHEREQLFEAVKKYIGLGYGLTPSGDDFICGMLYAFHRMKRKVKNAEIYASSLSDAVMQHIEGTNEVSREYLACACDGVDFEIIDRVIVALTDGFEADNDKEKNILTESMSALLSVGASSGSDILCGVLFGMYILGCQYENNA